MKTKDLYQAKNACCGCELCAQTCPKNIIQMIEDEEGFLYPNITDDTACINCKRCINVCPEKAPGRNRNQIKQSFSFSLKDENDLKRSASGGLATAISREFIIQGGVVYGVGYSEDYLTIRFARASKVQELEQFRGSKYAQAYKNAIYQQVKKDLKDSLRVLFIGLPCEVSALYHAVGNNEKLYTISLICHGPTSQKVHRDYCNSLPCAGKSQMTFFSVRYKKKGWKPYYIQVNYADGSEHSEAWNPSDYGTAFLFLKRPSCRTCKYKAENEEFGLQADMVIGDFHGVSKQSKEFNPWGVSQGSVLTDKGKKLTSLISGEYELIEIPYSHIRITNQGLFSPIPQRGNKNRFLKDYLNNSLNYACNSPMVKFTNRWMKIRSQLIRLRSLKKLPKKVKEKIKTLIHS